MLAEAPGLRMDLSDFLMVLPPIRPRQVRLTDFPALSSNAHLLALSTRYRQPLDVPNRASLIVSILKGPHISGPGAIFHGTASTYLSHLVPGTPARADVRPSTAGFHPPLDPSVPIIMAAAGSGIAPFRAFVQERAVQSGLICHRTWVIDAPSM